MVYVARDGTIRDSKPLGLSSIFDLFWGILNFIYLFVVTLFSPGQNRRDPRYSVDFRPPGSNGPSDNNPRHRGFGPSGSPGAPPPPGCGCGG